MNKVENLKVKDIMTRKLVVLRPDDSAVFGAKLLSDNHLNGLPVVDKEGRLIGILTEFDLISQSNEIHLPTLINILGNISFYKKDRKIIQEDMAKLMNLKVRDIMNTDPLSIEETAWIQEVADLFAHHHRVNPIPAVNSAGKLSGIVSRYDLVKLFADRNAKRQIEERPVPIDKKIDDFINDFEDRFTVISKERVKTLTLIYFACAAAIFIIGLALALKIFF